MNPECDKKSKILCIHHINYKKLFTTDTNLITLCLSCNSKANKNREKWKNLYWNMIGKIYGFNRYVR
jgi:hypothetical protein